MKLRLFVQTNRPEERPASSERWVQDTIPAWDEAEEPRLVPGIYHWDGTAWHQAPVPSRRHRCIAQTRGQQGGFDVERCACGAIRLGQDRPWAEVNQRKKGTS